MKIHHKLNLQFLNQNSGLQIELRLITNVVMIHLQNEDDTEEDVSISGISN